MAVPEFDRLAVQEKIKSQGEIVRKLKADKADKDKVWLFTCIIY